MSLRRPTHRRAATRRPQSGRPHAGRPRAGRPHAGRPDLGRWLLAPLGLVLAGAGLSITVDAGLRRAAGAPTRRWVAQGTAGLVAFNSGLSVFGDAVARGASTR